MREYGHYCPVALASGVLADRWTLLIVRELILGSHRFNDIARGLPGISRTLLRQRLRHLERKGVLERVPVAGARGLQYDLTPAGRDLEGVIMAIGEWAVRWMLAEPEPDEVDPLALTHWMGRRVDAVALPAERVIIEFDYRGASPVRLWMILDRREPSICTDHPGFDSDLVVTTAPVELMRVFSGFTSLPAAMSAGRLDVAGPPRLVRSLPGWFRWSPFASTVRERVGLDA